MVATVSVICSFLLLRGRTSYFRFPAAWRSLTLVALAPTLNQELACATASVDGIGKSKSWMI
jgi:hypothetical protein